jgi:hypothetical protein
MLTLLIRLRLQAAPAVVALVHPALHRTCFRAQQGQAGSHSRMHRTYARVY